VHLFITELWIDQQSDFKNSMYSASSLWKQDAVPCSSARPLRRNAAMDMLQELVLPTMVVPGHQHCCCDVGQQFIIMLGYFPFCIAQ
jgi:hypothetical protein